jgi:hypothetical protein
MVCVVCMALFSFWTVARSVWVKTTELAVHRLLMSFAVVTELMLVTANKKFINYVVVTILINNSTHLGAPVSLLPLQTLA